MMKPIESEHDKKQRITLQYYRIVLYSIMISGLFEAIRGLSDGRILGSGIFLHLGDFDNGAILFILLVFVCDNMRWLGSRLGNFLLCLATVVSTYLILDAELQALPLITAGTADVRDIPAGILGVIVGIALYFLRSAYAQET